MRNIYSGWLSGNALKLLACITMFLDHLGAFLFPGVLWLRLVGRTAMPLFAFTLAEGCFFTRSKGRHLALIGRMGLVTSTVASIATGEVQGDILITFALSCLVIGGLDALKQACFSERARAGRIALSLRRRLRRPWAERFGCAVVRASASSTALRASCCL